MATLRGFSILVLSCCACVFAQYPYYQYSLPYSLYRFCVYNLNNCRVNTYANFCLVYDNMCNNPMSSNGGYYSILVNRYCPVWCSTCSASYRSSCATTVPSTSPPPRTKCAYSDFRNIKPKVLNGNLASQCENPWTVALHPSTVVPAGAPLPPICQGVIIGRKTVATTLECIDLLEPFGTHPNYNVTIGEYIWLVDEPADENIPATVQSVDYTSGLVKLSLSRQIDGYSNCVAPACLPSSDRTINIDRSKCQITGWGTSGANPSIPVGPATTLMMGDVVIPTETECANLLATLKTIPALGFSVNFPDATVTGCTSVTQSKSSACSGDEGGAVICQEATTHERILVGLIRSGGCRDLMVTFFTNITSLLP